MENTIDYLLTHENEMQQAYNYLISENKALKEQLKRLEKIMQQFCRRVELETCLTTEKTTRGKNKIRVVQCDSNGLVINIYSSQKTAHIKSNEKLSNIQYKTQNKKDTTWQQYTL